jgi:hypothetical protein
MNFGQFNAVFNKDKKFGKKKLIFSMYNGKFEEKFTSSVKFF